MVCTDLCKCFCDTCKNNADNLEYDNEDDDILTYSEDEEDDI